MQTTKTGPNNSRDMDIPLRDRLSHYRLSAVQKENLPTYSEDHATFVCRYACVSASPAGEPIS
jgi:hypothetical protein